MVEKIEAVPVRGRRDLQRFIDFPYSFYRRDPYWAPPLRIAQKELLDFQKHPFYRNAEAQLFLARRGPEIVGRIAAILNHNHNRFHNESAGFFGFFECVEDQGAADSLLGAAREWLVSRGATIIRGPVSPSTNYECGLLVDGFDSCPHIMMTYNPPYYSGLLVRAGLRKAKDLYAYYSHTETFPASKFERLARRSAEANQVRIRPIRMKAFQEDVEAVWEVYNSAWSRNWGFVPMTRDEFLFMSRDMKSILDPNLVLLGEVENRVVGFALALPDINQALKHANGRLFPLGLLKILYHKRSINSMRIAVLGVIERYRSAGVAAGFYAELFRQAQALGYKGGEMSWVLEDNVLMCRSAEALGGKRYKTYRIYEWT